MEGLLGELISIPSQSGNEKRLAEYIARWMDQHGVERFEQDGNVVAYISGKNPENCLILNGHIDTVGVGDPGRWDSNPFEPKVADGKMYGLGSSDMKAGVAVLMGLSALYAKEQPECDIWFSFVRGEEIDGHGTQSFISWFQQQPQAAIYKRVEALIAEPTDASFIEIGHRGNQFVKIAVETDSGHASQPEKVPNPAIKVAGKIIKQLQELEDAWASDFAHEQLGTPTIALTGIWAGDLKAPNKIAGEAIMQLDVRTTPELHAKTSDEINTFLADIYDKAKVVSCEGSPAGWTDESAFLRQIFKSYFPEMQQQVMRGSSDLCFFTDADIPAVIFGPGTKATMHNINEYTNLAPLQKSYDTIREIVRAYADA